MFHRSGLRERVYYEVSCCELSFLSHWFEFKKARATLKCVFVCQVKAKQKLRFEHFVVLTVFC